MTAALSAAILSMSGSAPAAKRAPKKHTRSVGCRVAFRLGKTVLADAQAGVFALQGDYLGCWFPSPRVAVVLGPSNNSNVSGQGGFRLNDFAVNGSTAAYFSLSENGLGDAYQVVVVDLRQRRFLARFPTGQLSQSQLAPLPAMGVSVIGVGPTTGVVVTASGGVAWIVHDTQAPDAPTYQVWKANRGSAPTMLAAGNDIDPSSLALGGATLYWSQGGSAHSSSLS